MRISKVDCDRLMNKLAFWLKRWYSYPLAYVIEAVGATPTHQQAAILDALRFHRFVAIRSGHGIGKSKLLGWIINWYLDTHRISGVPCRVPCTGPTGGQLSDILWSEVENVLKAKPEWLGNRYTITSDHLTCNEQPKGWFAALRTARAENPDALQGFHRCLYIIDEAAGVAEQVFEVARGAMGDPGSMGIMTGNPTRLSGYFFNTFKRGPGGLWHLMHCDSRDTMADQIYTYPFTLPNGEIKIIETPGLQTQQWVDEMAEEFGEDSNTFKVRVLGEFASAAKDLVIKPEWLEAVADRPVTIDPGARVKFGVDVARYGDDDSALVVRQGDAILHAEFWHGADTVETVNRVRTRASEYHPHRIYIDTIGLGAGVFDVLRSKHYPVEEVQAGERAPETEEADCRLVRDFLWWQGRIWFWRRPVSYAGDSATWEILSTELASPGYTFDKKGKVVIESKQDLKKRKIRSPNLADALLMTLAADSGVKPARSEQDNSIAARKRRAREAKTRSWKLI